jgi:hypothetical protein
MISIVATEATDLTSNRLRHRISLRLGRIDSDGFRRARLADPVSGVEQERCLRE